MSDTFFKLGLLFPELSVCFFIKSVMINISHIGTYGLLVGCAGILFNILYDISSYFRDFYFGFFKHIKTALDQKLVKILFRGEPICVVKAIAITRDNIFCKEFCRIFDLHGVIFTKFFGFHRLSKITPSP